MQNTQVVSRLASKPKLALVVGSGGVRSVGAVGIVDALAKEGITPDLVVGCSSGALIGAAIALKWSSEQTLQALMKFWAPELTEQRKWHAYVQMLMPKLAGFNAEFSLRDDRLIRRAVETGFGDRLIESLPIALRITATSAHSGTPVTLSRGKLADAIRASMAVPILFPSVEIGGQRFLDGVLSDPLPISAAHDAHTVIALGFEGVMPRRIDRMSRMVAQTSTALINNLMHARMIAAKARGQQVIDMELKLTRRVGLWETAAMPYLFEQGRIAAAERMQEIKDALSGHARCEVSSPHEMQLQRA